jgi:hypothetical protein
VIEIARIPQGDHAAARRRPGARAVASATCSADQGDRYAPRSGRVGRAFVQKLFEDPSVTVVQTDPHPANVRAIGCYEAAGFARVGIVQTPDGEALLMRCARLSR